MSNTWTDDRVSLLKQLCEAGYSASKIATRLGEVTRNAVIGKLYRLGLYARGNAGSPPRVKAWPSTVRSARVMTVIKSDKPIVNDSPAEEIYGPPRPPCTLMDLTNETCRWPVSDGLFCGRLDANLLGREPYCREHALRAWTRPRARETAYIPRRVL